MITLVIFIAALAVLVLSHEFGHFLAAKKSGMKVEEFGFGFPPRLLSFKKGETVYSINLIPFGGFVRIFGEDSTKPEPRSFSSRPIWQRAIVLLAGVFFNLLLAWMLFSTVFVVGAPTLVDENESGDVVLLEIQRETPAMEVGLMPGDVLLKLSVPGEVLEISDITSIQDFISRNAGNEIEIEFMRGKKIENVVAVPNTEPESGKGALGIVMGKMGLESFPIHEAVWEGLKTTGFMLKAITVGIFWLIVDLIKGVPGTADQVAGPVGIYMIFDSVSGLGFSNVLFLVAYISTLLAIINFIPFPALDGGRFLFLMIEWIKGSPVNQKATTIANTAGFVFLLLIMAIVTYKDILRLLN